MNNNEAACEFKAIRKLAIAVISDALKCDHRFFFSEHSNFPIWAAVLGLDVGVVRRKVKEMKKCLPAST